MFMLTLHGILSCVAGHACADGGPLERHMRPCVNIMFNLAARLWTAPLHSQYGTQNLHVAQLAQK